jgi:hypothetical protein
VNLHTPSPRQFCPRCVGALQELVERERIELAYPEARALAGG